MNNGPPNGTKRNGADSNGAYSMAEFKATFRKRLVQRFAFTSQVVADIIVTTMESMDLKYPEVTADHRRSLAEAKALLEMEKK